MANPSMVIMESDYSRFNELLQSLSQDANAKFCFLLDKAGQHLAAAGDLEGVDSTALASLTAGNVAATEGVAQLVGEDEFTTLYHEGKQDNLHISLIGDRVILLVVFDERSSLGLVRLRVDQALPGLSEAVQVMLKRSYEGGISREAPSVFSEITEDDIDALFG